MTSQTSAASLAETRVDLVGSFLRPAELRQAMLSASAGDAAAEALLPELQDRAITELVAVQEQHGLPIVTDGEYRRTHYTESIAGVEGLEPWLAGIRESVAETDVHRLAEDEEVQTGGPHLYRTPRLPITRPVRLAVNRALAEYQFAQGLTELPVKGSVLGAQYFVHGFDPAGSRSTYGSREAFTDDLVAALRSMVDELVAAGCRYVHVDGPGYTVYVDPSNLEAMRAEGTDPDEEMARAIDADNAVIAGLGEATSGIHLCRGNRYRFWHREGGYEAIAERLFNGLAHRRFMLEYDSERAGDFSPLRFLPKGKIAVLGLITTKYPEVETVDDLKRRIDEAARFVPVEQLAISPQCGFASMVPGNLLSEEAQWRKLDVMLETARQVWA